MLGLFDVYMLRLHNVVLKLIKQWSYNLSPGHVKSRLAYRPIDISSWTFQPMMGGQPTSKRGLDKAIEATPGRRRPRDADANGRRAAGVVMPCVMTEIGRHQPLRSGSGSCEADAFGIVLPNLCGLCFFR